MDYESREKKDAATDSVYAAEKLLLTRSKVDFLYNSHLNDG